MGRARPQLIPALQRRLPDPARQALQRAVSLADDRNVSLYLVGGGVRDLLLGTSQLDLDLVVEGDALALASAIGAAFEARVVRHARFGTAVVQGAGFRLDLARARTEAYERPGALPAVQPATLAEDLARRDFTINAIALRLSSPRAGELIDPHDGRDDLIGHAVRVLHEVSFRDDATRILRALRYATRFGFAIERRTKALLRRDLSYLDTIGGTRLRHEFERIAQEERAEEIVTLAQRLGVLPAVHPALRAGERTRRGLRRLADVVSSRRAAVCFALLLADAAPAEAESAAGRLALTGGQREAVGGAIALLAAEALLARDSLRPSEAVRLLAPHPIAAIEAFSLIAERAIAAERARCYLQNWRFVRPRLNGRDVEELGVAHGPQIGTALEALREARLDGRSSGRDDEIALVRTMRRRPRALSEARRG